MLRHHHHKKPSKDWDYQTKASFKKKITEISFCSCRQKRWCAILSNVVYCVRRNWNWVHCIIGGVGKLTSIAIRLSKYRCCTWLSRQSEQNWHCCALAATEDPKRWKTDNYTITSIGWSVAKISSLKHCIDYTSLTDTPPNIISNNVSSQVIQPDTQKIQRHFRYKYPIRRTKKQNRYAGVCNSCPILCVQYARGAVVGRGWWGYSLDTV